MTIRAEKGVSKRARGNEGRIKDRERHCAWGHVNQHVSKINGPQRGRLL